MNMRWILPALGCVLLFVSACKREEVKVDPAAGPVKAKLQLNWKPETQFGGFYAAQLADAYKKNGLEVTIEPVGQAGQSTVQMLGAKSVDFAILSADELVIARANQDAPNKLVAVFAVYQTNPQGLMVHRKRGLTDVGQIFAEGTVAFQKDLPYGRMLEKKYGFSRVKLLPSPFGDLTLFRRDEKVAVQVFVFSEPLDAGKLGLDVQVFSVATDVGYNPYTTVLAVREEYLKANPEVVKKMVAAVREGWTAYLADPKPANAAMSKLRPEMTVDVLAEMERLHRPLVLDEGAKPQEVGKMTEQRWQTLIDQLHDLGFIKTKPAAKDCFANP